MDKKTQTILVLIVIFLGLVTITLRNKKISNEPLSENVTESTVATSTNKDILATTDSNSNIPATQTGNIPNRAWATFEKYIEYARTHNIEGVRSLSHKFNGTCSKAKESEEMEKKCFAILDSVYETGISMNKSDYSNVAFDSKQIILSTNPKKTDSADKVEITKNLIYFTISTNNEIKLLALELGRSFTVKKAGLTNAELNLAVEERIKDSDNDGIENAVESCLIKTTTSACKPTDPFQKDSNNNGYWDGIEPLL